ncbi:MAG: iron-containing alcohol dehydrogenase, partial [Acidobacteriota bacterium]|nr:iron-containing alcohol dehydrogenase [Acidobacteriota bacterium]
KAGHANRALEVLAPVVETVVFDDVEENPTTSDVARGVEFARGRRVEAIVALGGGSAMDCAKGINFLLTNGGQMEDYWGFGKATKPMLPSIAVPTTAGTGSEAQSYALISQDETNAKMACGDHKARFRTIVLDPTLMATLEGAAAAVSGIDAVSHAVESFVTRTRNPVSTLFSKEAWNLLDDSFEPIVRGTADDRTRGRMLIGSFLAGAAIEHSMLGAAHACANPLTASRGVVHGHAVGLMLPHVVRFNAVEVGEQYEELHPGGAGTLITRVAELQNIGRLPVRLRDLDVPRDGLPIFATAAAEQWTAQHNPRAVTAKELLDLYEAAY